MKPMARFLLDGATEPDYIGAAVVPHANMEILLTELAHGCDGGRAEHRSMRLTLANGARIFLLARQRFNEAIIGLELSRLALMGNFSSEEIGAARSRLRLHDMKIKRF